MGGGSALPFLLALPALTAVPRPSDAPCPVCPCSLGAAFERPRRGRLNSAPHIWGICSNTILREPLSPPLFVFTTQVAMPLTAALIFHPFLSHPLHGHTGKTTGWHGPWSRSALFLSQKDAFPDTSDTGLYSLGGRWSLLTGGPIPNLSPQPRRRPVGKRRGFLHTAFDLHVVKAAFLLGTAQSRNFHLVKVMITPPVPSPSVSTHRKA